MTNTTHLSRFFRFFWLTIAIFIICIVIFGLYVRAEKLIDRSNESRQQSILLAEELRHSSDDLTRMVRSYIITGNPLYKQHFQEILDIRDGKTPRPVNYENIYWDLVLEDDRRPTPSGKAIALLELMRHCGYTEDEFAKISEAKSNSDTLAQAEFAAMNLVDSTNPPTQTNRLKAIQMLHDSAYHQAKAAIMKPINEVNQMLNERTLKAVHAAEVLATEFRIAFICFGLLFIIMCCQAYRALYSTLGGSLVELHHQITLLGSDNFSSDYTLAKGMENSIMAWVLETKANLVTLNEEKKGIEIKNQRLTKLYAALSQCNQAIVRCQNEEDLFAHICMNAVKFGGMKMAWIGMLDEHSKQIKPVAHYGSGTEYLDGIDISIDENLLSGKGPTGTSIRENRPCWCQDFQNDPSTNYWRERNKNCTWKSSGALPLHKNNQPVGSFSLYSDDPNGFDDAACRLLEEMAMDISYALQSYQLERHRQASLEMEGFRTFMLELLTGGVSLNEILKHVALKLETILPGSLCSILVLDETERYLHLGAAPSLPDFYNNAIDGEAIGPGVGSCGNTCYTGKRTIVTDIDKHPFWVTYKDLAKKAGLKSCWSEPILSKGEKALGSFAIYQRHPSSPDDHQIKLLEMAAHFVALALERKRAEEHIYKLANFDPLTKLPNRTQLNDHLKYAISLARRSNGCLALMFLDLDHFKDINDTLGHSIGDNLLIELAARLRRLLREEDTVTRLGGDEFILLLPGVDSHAASYVAEKLLDAIAQTYRIEHYELNLTASIGIALYPNDGADLETLSKSADTAMYRAKQEGRQGYRFFTPQMQAQSIRNLQVLHSMRQALEQQQLQLYYQPQVSIADQQIIGAEALLRWLHPELGWISPAEFIPIAEDSGLIIPIGEWVLKTAVQQAKNWMDQGFPPITMAVNLSAIQFRQPDFPNLISRVLYDSGLPAQYLELELTEGVAMHNPEEVIAIISNFHQLGIRMSIDDFGTGYSSLSYLKKFKVYKLKIDQSFVRDITTDPEDKAIVTAIISLAKSLGLKTIAEGVETLEQQIFLQEQGCEEIQGYLFSKPLPVAEFEKKRHEGNKQNSFA